MSRTHAYNQPRGPNGSTRRYLAYGADYNPEQWSREVWVEDVRLMREAGVNIVNLGIFSWARVQTGPDTWDFTWLDEVMDLLHDNGITVDLATATASPPAWLTTAHPEILPVTHTGETLWPGARQHWRPTSPVFREHALRLAEAMAERYGKHPALVAWHVSNELGCHNIYDYSEDAATAFRGWLRDRYGTLDALNHAWGTAFWSQTYTDWEQILPPRLAASHANPTQQLDFKRFSSDALLEYFRAEREILRRFTPHVPVTTNFMVMGHITGMNYAEWAHEVDFVSNDHYVHPGPQRLDELSFSANLTSGLARGRPWYLMEHSTSAVNWQPVNVPKAPGELSRDSLLHVAHGADAVCYFPWRQSAAGADSRVFREVTELGRVLGEDLVEVAGTERRRSRTAIVIDWESRWAVERDSLPRSGLDHHQEALDWYSAFLDLGVRADVVPSDAPLEGYDTVIAPMLNVLPQDVADHLTAYVNGGGHLVTTYFSGVVDQNDHVHPGGSPGPLRELLGIRVEEFAPLLDGASLALDDGSVATLWSDDLAVIDPSVTVLASYASGHLSGQPAITRRPAPGGGSATYVSTHLNRKDLTALSKKLLETFGVHSELPEELRERVELTVRAGEAAEYWFLTNRTEESVSLAGLAGEPLTGLPKTGEHTLPARGTVVLRVPSGS